MTAPATLTCTVDDLLIRQAHCHPAHIPRPRRWGEVIPACKAWPRCPTSSVAWIAALRGPPWSGCVQACWCRSWVSGGSGLPADDHSPVSNGCGHAPDEGRQRADGRGAVGRAMRPTATFGPMTGQALSRASRERACELRRLGDLNPGRARTLTALAARIVAVPLGSAWTNVFGRSSLDGPARR